jgi:hypothetical protein
MSNLDLESVIENSISDANLDTTPEVEVDSTPEAPLEAAPEAPEAPISEEVVPESVEVASPAVRATEVTQPAVQDEFGKKFGIQPESVPGRENRIPYSRVKKIVEKAELEARKAAETPYLTKVQEFETKVKEYEAKLSRVDQFEHVMVNDVPRFIGMLKTLPQYQQFFDQLEKASQVNQAPAQPVNDDDPMPQPDQLQPDGTLWYSMEGIEKLNEWNRKQARKEVLAEVEKTYGPIAQEWNAHREANERIRQVVPVIQAQIQDARTWDQFSENEAEIVKALQSDRNLSLEGAYRKIVVPKLRAQRAESETNETELKKRLRAELLEELRRAPAASSAPVRVTRPSPISQGKRTLEEIIAEQVANANLK